MNRRSVLAILAVAALGAPPLAAQSESEVAAYSALLGTPMGALPPLLTSTMIGVPLRSAQLAVRYGHAPAGPDLATLGNVAATVLIPGGLTGVLHVTGGVVHASCSGCKTHLMASVGGNLALRGDTLGASPNAGRLNVVLAGGWGTARPIWEIWSAARRQSRCRSCSAANRRRSSRS